MSPCNLLRDNPAGIVQPAQLKCAPTSDRCSAFPRRNGPAGSGINAVPDWQRGRTNGPTVHVEMRVVAYQNDILLHPESGLPAHPALRDAFCWCPGCSMHGLKGMPVNEIPGMAYCSGTAQQVLTDMTKRVAGR